MSRPSLYGAFGDKHAIYVTIEVVDGGTGSDKPATDLLHRDMA